MSRPALFRPGSRFALSRPTPRAALSGLAVGRTVLGSGAAALLLVLPAAAASAHVTVNPASTAAGAFTVLDFRVPTESDTAGTVRLEITLPTATPLASVRTRPLAGWDAEVVRGALPQPVEVDGATLTEAPLSVVWTAQPGTQVGPGQYEDFSLSVGPLPEAGTELVLPATQTYSDGEVVAWDEPVPAGGEEPEHPAPALTTTDSAASGDSHGAGHEAGAEAAEGADPAAADSTADSAGSATAASGTATATGEPDVAARLLGGGGLLLGAGALALAATRGRSRTR
jgi:uncharacterized protein YcnI